mmetsp:Transcript_48649/g.97357  ORF Transcript_48649/g.97357 Transcript_48649/m.97357 type:complete len:323 (+) Transcript_48649:878-1846(+)
MVHLPDDNLAKLRREEAQARLAELVALLHREVEVDPLQDLLLHVRGNVVLAEEVHHRLRDAPAFAREMAHGGDGALDLGEEHTEHDGAHVHDDHAEQLLGRVRRVDVAEPDRREHRVHKVGGQHVLLHERAVAPDPVFLHEVLHHLYRVRRLLGKPVDASACVDEERDTEQDSEHAEEQRRRAEEALNRVEDMQDLNDLDHSEHLENSQWLQHPHQPESSDVDGGFWSRISAGLSENHHVDPRNRNARQQVEPERAFHVLARNEGPVVVVNTLENHTSSERQKDLEDENSVHESINFESWHLITSIIVPEKTNRHRNYKSGV